jgi:thioredoxin 1
MGAAKELTTANFKDTISSGVTLVDFWAEWCGPCKMMTPLIEEMAQEFEGKATIAKLDIDAEGDLAIEHNVQSIPTLIVFKDGEEANRFIGVTKKDALVEAVNAASN